MLPHNLQGGLFMKRLCLMILISVLLMTGSLAEEASIDLDLTAFTGNILTDKVSDIRSNPASYDGMTVRIRGQYYAYGTEPDMDRSLIVCENSCCLEVGMKLLPADGADPVWPENNQVIEIVGTVESYETATGNIASRLRVLSVNPASLSN